MQSPLLKQKLSMLQQALTDASLLQGTSPAGVVPSGYQHCVALPLLENAAINRKAKAGKSVVVVRRGMMGALVLDIPGKTRRIERQSR